MQIIPLSEGAFSIDQTKIFVPFNKNADDLQERPRGSLLVEIQPFVVKTEKDIILVDTGLGYKSESGELQIHTNLRANGIEPEEVTKVLLSHLHKDHSGGISYQEDENSEKKLSFANAIYYINEAEFQLATEHPSSSYIEGSFDILHNNSQVILTPDTGSINETINYEVSGGHSLHHQVFWIKENTDILFFGGDVAPQLQQMKNKFIAKYDYNGKKSMELRQKWWAEGAKEHWSFLFYHDIKTPTISL